LILLTATEPNPAQTRLRQPCEEERKRVYTRFSRASTERTKVAVVESCGFCRWARPQHAFLSCPCGAVERRRYRAGALRRAAQHDEEGWILGQSGRFAQLEPVIRKTFDIASMARLSVGPPWASLTEAQRQQVTESFARYISAIYADRFDSYDGQKLKVIGEQPAVAGIMVRSQIVKANGEPVNVDYMMRRNGDSWLISDIYLDGAISEVATRRSEFAAILKSQGIDGLIAALNRKADILTATTAKAS